MLEDSDNIGNKYIEFGKKNVLPSSSDPVIVAAGDISCNGLNTSSACHQMEVSNLFSSINPTAILTLGDNQYPNGELFDYNTYFDPSWGRYKSIIKPVPGNHEYNTSGASGYYSYFGAAAGNSAKGYYSYNLGTWHVVALNSNCSSVSCSAGSTQEQWLRDDLASNPKACTLAYWHHPRFSSGAVHGDDSSTQAFWQALYEYKADVILVGHEHHYERFAPQNPSGIGDSSGIRQFVVGTGGKSLYNFGKLAANSEIRNANNFGLLKMALRSDSYDWQFIPETSGSFSDSGNGNCVIASSTTPSPSSAQNSTKVSTPVTATTVNTPATPTTTSAETTRCQENTELGVVTAEVNVPYSGGYSFWSRVKGTDQNSDSYYLKFGSECYEIGSEKLTKYNEWLWLEGGSAGKINLDLTEGKHTFKLLGKEAGLKLDEIILGYGTCNPYGKKLNCG